MLPAINEMTLQDTSDEETTAVYDTGAPPPSTERLSEGGVPRLHSDSVAEFTATNVSDLVSELARLWDPSSVPRMTRPVSAADRLAPPEAFVASLVSNDISLQTLVDLSPMQEDATLRCLARLVTSRIVALHRAAPAPAM
jgi:hypothetical protein